MTYTASFLSGRRRWLSSVGFALTILAVAGQTFLATPAMASTASTLSGDITTNEVYRFYTQRSWMLGPYKAFQTPREGTKGGTLVIGLRDRNDIQFGRAEGRQGEFTQFHRDNGDVKMPPGIFFINAKSTGACGGSGCGVFRFESYLEWGF